MTRLREFTSRNWLELILGIVILVFVVLVAGKAKPAPASETKTAQSPPPATQTKTAGKPKLTISTVISGLTNPWDIGFLEDESFIYTERPGQINHYDHGSHHVLIKPTDAIALNEGGMMGVAVDPNYKTNRYVYTCFMSNISGKADIRLVRWKTNDQVSALTDRKDILTGMPVNNIGETGRHSGCRPRFGPDGFLWVGTGDAAMPGTAQDHKNLGGKILRIDRDGNPATGNLGGDFDPRIYSYGHRNVQGLAFNIAAGKPVGYSIEHGSDVDDEINALDPGNFGWAPTGTKYNETGVPMTDKNKFPDAKDALWSSGKPTVATSGATLLLGKQWGGWEGALAVAVLKGTELRIFSIGSNGGVTGYESILKDHGRLRSAVQGIDGNLYVSTDNGKGHDEILKIVPSAQ